MGQIMSLASMVTEVRRHTYIKQLYGHCHCLAHDSLTLGCKCWETVRWQWVRVSVQCSVSHTSIWHGKAILIAEMNEPCTRQMLGIRNESGGGDLVLRKEQSYLNRAQCLVFPKKTNVLKGGHLEELVRVMNLVAPDKVLFTGNSTKQTVSVSYTISAMLCLWFKSHSSIQDSLLLVLSLHLSYLSISIKLSIPQVFLIVLLVNLVRCICVIYVILYSVVILTGISKIYNKLSNAWQ